MFDLLSEPWCHQNTRFPISQLRAIYRCLDLPERIYIKQGCAQYSSEYAFTIMAVKLVTGMTKKISKMYCMMIGMVDSMLCHQQ
jgi:hypothetical protein